MPANSLPGFPLRFFQNFLTLHPDIKVLSPTDPEWDHAQRQFYISYAERPSVIARPQHARQIQDLVRLCASYNVNFVVRAGGHDCAGRSQVNGALTIDMRDIKHVHVSEDRQTAMVGGGILIQDLTKALGDQGLVTPTWVFNRDVDEI